jgi:hypothetical protein
MADAHLRPVLYSHRFKSGETSGSSLRKRQRQPAQGGLHKPLQVVRRQLHPELAREGKELSPGAKLCYVRLSRYADRRTGMAWPKQETLGEDLGVSPPTIRDYLGELEKHSLIESEQRGFGRPNRYRFLQHPCLLPIKTGRILPVLLNSKRII